jgi:hypothetical protein
VTAEGGLTINVDKDQLLYCQFKSDDTEIYQYHPDNTVTIQYNGSEESASIRGMVVTPAESRDVDPAGDLLE